MRLPSKLNPLLPLQVPVWLDPAHSWFCLGEMRGLLPLSCLICCSALCLSLCLVRSSSLCLPGRMGSRGRWWSCPLDHCSRNLAGVISVQTMTSLFWGILVIFRDTIRVLQPHCSLLKWSVYLVDPSGTTPECLTLTIQVTDSYCGHSLGGIPSEHLKPDFS